MSSKRRAFILDFDGTITTEDTISTILEFAVSVQASKGEPAAAIRDRILSEYNEDYSKHVNNYSPTKDKRNTLAEEIDYYRSLHGVENRSFERVSKSKLFWGISNNEWQEFGRDAVKDGKVVIREGFGNFVKEVETSGGIWGVVSVNFSSQFIRGVLASAGVDTSMVGILANHPDENGILFGPETGKCWSVMATSDAKLASMKDMVNSWTRKQGTHFSQIVYIGDSGTDIECLTEERTNGIVMAENYNSSLMQTLTRVGVEVKHIDSYQDGQEAKVHWARDFQEIVRNSSLMSQIIS
jgi:2-hydroxy-3-keto-5-methylthiopentenyl-1-phosphate phosphatase